MYANCLRLCRQWKTQAGLWDGETQREERAERMSTFLNVLFKNLKVQDILPPLWANQSWNYVPPNVYRITPTQPVKSVSVRRSFGRCEKTTLMMSQWCHQVCLSFGYNSHKRKIRGFERRWHLTGRGLKMHYGKCKIQQLLALCPSEGLKCQNISVSGAFI